MDESIEVYRRNFKVREKRLRQERETERQRALQSAQEAIPAVASRYPSLQRVYLFGSILQPGMFHRKSDIDVAVEGSSPRDYFDFWRVLDEMLSQWAVDVREIDNLDDSSFFANRVRQYGLLIYERQDS
jgi:uncharacterized protein